MTVCSALPSWLPFGGDALSSTAYEAIARPLGIVYLLILAVCPLLAWGKTDPAKFVRQARVPAICAVALFALLAFWWATQFVPVYDAMMAKGNAASQTLLEAGSGWYYNGLALVGLLVASLLLFNALFMFVRNVRVPGKRGAAPSAAGSRISRWRSSSWGSSGRPCTCTSRRATWSDARRAKAVSSRRLSRSTCGVPSGIRERLDHRQQRADGYGALRGYVRRVQERALRRAGDAVGAARRDDAAAEAQRRSAVLSRRGPVRRVPRRERRTATSRSTCA